MTAARRPVTVRERILRLLRTTLAASRDTLAQHARTVEQAQRERNAALDRAAIAERRLAAHCAEWAPRAADAGLLNAPTHPGAALTDTAHAQPSGDIPS